MVLSTIFHGLFIVVIHKMISNLSALLDVVATFSTEYNSLFVLCMHRFLKDNSDFKFKHRGNMEFKNVSKPIPCYWLLEHTGHEVQGSIPDLVAPLPPVVRTRVRTHGHHFDKMPNVLMFCYFVILLYSLLTFCEHYLY